MADKCEECGTDLVETGAPIWEIYCPNRACGREKRLFREAMAQHQKRRRGRPAKDEAEAKRHPIGLRTTRRLKETLEHAARESGRSIAQEIEFRLERSFLLDEVGAVVREALGRGPDGSPDESGIAARP